MIRKLHFFLTAILPIVFVSAQPAETANTVAEQMPYFMGCSDFETGTAEKRKCSNENLIDFISRNIQYPEPAREEGIEGTVLAQFVINRAGQIESPKVLRDIGGNCGKEALRIIDLMPNWEPAINDGKTVEVNLNLPVTFSLQDDEYLIKSKYQIQWGALSGKQTSLQELKDQLPKKLYVRDEFGNEVDLSSLVFIFQRKRYYKEQASTGKINNKMEKLINKKVKKKGLFTIVAIIQREGNLYEIERSFELVNEKQ